MSTYYKQELDFSKISDVAELEALRFNNIRHSILGFMLGDFDENGNYVVSPEICQELISMKKYIVDTVDNVEICNSQIKLDGQVKFLVTFEKDRATLSLAERVNFEANVKSNSGAYSNIIEFVLDVVETSGEIDRNVIYNKWNISQYPLPALDIFSLDDEILAGFFHIVDRYKYLLISNIDLLQKESELEDAESAYACSLLEIASHYPKLNDAIKAELKTELNDKKDLLKLDKPYFAKTLNEIINKVVANNLQSLNKEDREAFEAEKHNAYSQYNLAIEELLPLKSLIYSGKKIRVLDTRKQEDVFLIAPLAKKFVDVLTEVNNKRSNMAVETIEALRGANQPNARIELVRRVVSFTEITNLLGEETKKKIVVAETKVEKQSTLVKEVSVKKEQGEAKKPAGKGKPSAKKKAKENVKQKSGSATKSDKPIDIVGLILKKYPNGRSSSAQPNKVESAKQKNEANENVNETEFDKALNEAKLQVKENSKNDKVDDNIDLARDDGLV